MLLAYNFPTLFSNCQELQPVLEVKVAVAVAAAVVVVVVVDVAFGAKRGHSYCH